MVGRLTLGLARPWGSMVAAPESPEEPAVAKVNQARITSMALLIVVGTRILAISMGMIKLPAHIGEMVLGLELSTMQVWGLVEIA